MFATKRFKVMVYVTFWFCILLLEFNYCFGIHFGYKQLNYVSTNQRTQRRQIPFPLDQIFQSNAAEIAAASNSDFDYDFGNNNGRISQPADSENFSRTETQIQAQLPQIINNLITASGVQQPPAPQQIVRTVMNSGLKR